MLDNGTRETETCCKINTLFPLISNFWCRRILPATWLENPPMHYRLRWSFRNVEKKCKSNSLFLIHFWYHTPKKCLFGAAMTQILHRKKIRKILEDKICQQFQKTPKKVEGGLSGSWNFAWWKKGSCRVKKLKIATSTEAPFKVKMDF